MIYKKLYSNEEVPIIWQGASRVRNSITSEQIKIFKHGIELGMKCIDTAESYSGGTSEILIGSLLNEINRHDIFISNKVSPNNLKYNDVIKSINSSLSKLNTDYIDLYSIHWNNPYIELSETLQAFLDLKKEGKIRYIGVSNFTLPNIKKCVEILNGELATVQMEFNLVNRGCEFNIIPFCNKNNIIFTSWGSLMQGDLKFNPFLIKKLSVKYDKSIYQIILNWIIKNKNIATIIKSNNIHHMEDNSKSCDFIMSNEDYESINSYYEYSVIKIRPIDIECMSTGGNEEGNHPAYKTVEQAIENKYNFSPSPYELSIELSQTFMLPYPVYVINIDGNFKLVGGNIRYWAWVIAFGMNTEIECIELKNWDNNDI